MAYEYLQSLSLTQDQEAKLRSLGLASASSLLSLIQHSPDKFTSFFGEQEAQRLTALLPSLVPEEEKSQLAGLPSFQGKFGALLAPAEPTLAQTEATERRDELMNRIKMIRQSGSSSPKAKTLLESLENELRQGLKSTVSGV